MHVTKNVHVLQYGCTHCRSCLRPVHRHSLPLIEIIFSVIEPHSNMKCISLSNLSKNVFHCKLTKIAQINSKSVYKLQSLQLDNPIEKLIK